ncbi:MAG TPA: methyltransferase domain-containing protein, partial [Anaerolineales bacterium]|nr:methyltransferase domain-containing protein [Anaerolineales bacterium]
LELGWHYLLDWTWILSQLGPVKGKRILDAGAGTGLLQWYLARQGAEVLSVDRLSRANLPVRFRARFDVQGLRPEDLIPLKQQLQQNWASKEKLPARLSRQGRSFLSLAQLGTRSGKVRIYNQDLKTLSDIATDSVDGVVAVSALEHNEPEGLIEVVKELMRVLKPGAPLLATLVASAEQDWWHAPSSAWCYSAGSLRRIFELPSETPDNYADHALLFEKLVNNAELRNGLAKFYFKSGENGMPWGKWDPRYQPVGVCKVKIA